MRPFVLRNLFIDRPPLFLFLLLTGTTTKALWTTTTALGLYLVPSLLCLSGSTSRLPSLSKKSISERRTLITEYRQGAKLFLQSSDLGLPHPLSRRRVAPPPTLWSGEGTHSLAGEGLGESQFRREDICTLWCSIDICKYFVTLMTFCCLQSHKKNNDMVTINIGS